MIYVAAPWNKGGWFVQSSVNGTSVHQDRAHRMRHKVKSGGRNDGSWGISVFPVGHPKSRLLRDMQWKCLDGSRMHRAEATLRTQVSEVQVGAHAIGVVETDQKEQVKEDGFNLGSTHPFSSHN